MAKEIITSYVDDLDGGEAAEQVRFALDKGRYTIDLSAENAAELRGFLARYIAAAQIDRDPKSSARAVRQAKATDLAQVREWARGQGIAIKDRGRVPEKVLQAYREQLAA